MRKNLIRLACGAAIWACAFSHGWAASAVTGKVTVSTVPVPGATVVASQGDKRLVTSTDVQGAYLFSDLADGAWTISVEMLGFERASQDVTVTTGSEIPPANVELKLMSFDAVQGALKLAPPRPPSAPGTTPAQAAANRAAAPAAAPANAVNRGNATPANRPAAPAGAPPNAAAAAAPASGGGNPDLNGDGLLVNGSVNNGAASPFAQLAAFGNNRRGLRSLYNWSLGTTIGSSALDARPFSLSGVPTPRPSYTDAVFMGQFGGPVKFPGMINKPTIFLGYQRTSDHNVTTQSGIMPTAAERAGDFSGVVDSFGRPVQISDPTTGFPFPGNVIPPGAIVSQATALLPLYPLPNEEGVNGFNFQAPVLTVTTQDSFQSRLNGVVYGKNQFFGNVNYQRTTTNADNLFGFTDSNRVQNIEAAVNWNRRFSIFSTLRAGYRFTEAITDSTPYFSERLNVSGVAGISGNDQTPVNWGPPAFDFTSGLARLSTGGYAANHDLNHAFTAEGTWSHNRHNFIYGGGVTIRHLDLFSQQNARGTITFNGSYSGNDFADFLLGRPYASSIAFGNADKFFRAPSLNAYVTDDWRMSPTFTANVGVRWEYEAPMTETGNRLVNLDIAPGFANAAPVQANNPVGPLTGAHYPDSLVRPDRLGIQPRLAIAWRPIPGSSLVVRAGYGIYRNTQVYQNVASFLAQQPPLSTTASVTSSAVNALTLATPFATSGTSLANTFAVDPDLRVGFAQNWQVSVQRDLPASLTMNLTYLGTKGSHLMQELLPNTYPIGAVNPCPTCLSGYIYLQSDGHSLRNSGQFQLRRRLRNGFTATVQYTLSKATDNATAFSGASLAGSAIAQNWLDLSAEQAPSSFDQRHLVTVQFQYSTGQGLGGGAMMTGWRGVLFKGWTATSQLTVGSGMPFTPIYLTTVPGTGVTGTIHASLTGQPTAAGGDGVYLDPAGYAVPAAGEWGTAGRNSARGPSQFSLNGSVSRSFLISQRLTLDWRVEATNLLNRVVYASVNPYVTSSQFGLAAVANPMRKIQTVARLRF